MTFSGISVWLYKVLVVVRLLMEGVISLKALISSLPTRCRAWLDKLLREQKINVKFILQKLYMFILGIASLNYPQTSLQGLVRSAFKRK